jgi:hypothetical protein
MILPTLQSIYKAKELALGMANEITLRSQQSQVATIDAFPACKAPQVIWNQVHNYQKDEPVILDRERWGLLAHTDKVRAL